MNNTVSFIHDDGRRVYSVPVKLIVECTLFVLVKGELDDAKHHTAHVDLQEYFSFDYNSLTTDGESLLRIDDVITLPIDPSIVDITEMSIADYPPNEHPDFVGIPRR